MPPSAVDDHQTDELMAAARGHGVDVVHHGALDTHKAAHAKVNDHWSEVRPLCVYVHEANAVEWQTLHTASRPKTSPTMSPATPHSPTQILDATMGDSFAKKTDAMLHVCAYNLANGHVHRT